MEDLNQSLFLLLNAPADPNAFVLAFGIFFAEYAIWAVPAIVAVGWLRGSKETRKMMLEAAASAAAALFVNQIIALLWQHPRPFAMGLGHNFVAHAPDSSFPSDHLTLLWSVAFSLATHRGRRATGLALALLGLPVAWARIYVGVHFPLDMAGAVLVSAVGAWLVSCAQRRWMPHAYWFAIRAHRLLFGRLIALGWVRR
ncbi:undecaprenyl-diphosphatase [Trinickia mobilis]|uniref:undecaprenyl-diphosphatase n=1 Tax=Trinickia mobilis TaxID=2816356 RepID=UPI001A8C67A3|nr:undecaprenyl-diphosphatase [Trinickia mobilis]